MAQAIKVLKLKMTNLMSYKYLFAVNTFYLDL